MDKLLFFTLLSFIVPYSAQRCIIGAGWKRLSMGERLDSAHSVVYGRTIQHLSSVRTVYGQAMSVIDAMFEVYCVIKSGGETFNEIITIEGIAPRDGCSGSRGNMQIGQEAFIALKPTSDGNFEFDEPMPAQSAVFSATKSNFMEISSLCGLQSWSQPEDAALNKCPICGVANFTNVLLGEDETSATISCIVNGELVSGNSSNCDVILTANSEETEYCVPTSFDNTCTRLIYTLEQVNCVCTSNNVRGGSFINVSGGEKRRPSAFIAAMSLVFALMTKIW